MIFYYIVILVAHGSDISNEEYITQDVYSRYRSLVGDLMYVMHSRLLNDISNKTYIKCQIFNKLF